MLIILEGVDGSGKTTLCSQLEGLGATKISIDRGTKNQYGQYFYSRMKYEPTCDFLVTDRSFISDLVYRLEDGKDRDDMTLMEMCSLLKNDTKIILCETETSFEDAMLRGEDNITDKKRSENIKYLYNLVITMFGKFQNIPVYKYNWKKQNIDDVINFIKEVKK